MAYDNRFTSIRPIIESAYRDSGIDDINFETAIEDAAELVGLLGIPYAYIDKTTNGIDSPVIEIADYRAIIPDDLAYLKSIRKATLYSNGIILSSDEMLESSDIFHYDRISDSMLDGSLESVTNSVFSDLIGNTFTTSTPTESFLPDQPVMFSGDIFGSISAGVTYYINTVISNTEFTVSRTIGGRSILLSKSTGNMTITNTHTNETAIVISTSEQEDELYFTDGTLKYPDKIQSNNSVSSYKINNGIIFCDFKEGYIDIAYKSYPIDEDGYLLVPDDEKFRAALKYHLIHKIDYRRWRAFPEKPGLKALLNDSEVKAMYYAAAARNKSHIPSVDKMEAIKNSWLRSIARINEHKDGFKSLRNR